MKVDAIGSVPTLDDAKPGPIDAGSQWEETQGVDIPVPKDTTSDALQEKAARSIDQIRQEFAASFAGRNDWRRRMVSLNLSQAKESAPDDEAKVNALAREFSVPADMVRNYRQLFESRSLEKRSAALSDSHPKTAEFLTDSHHARLANDDIDNILALEGMVTNPEGFSIAGDFGDRASGVEIAPGEFTVDLARNAAAGAIGGAIKTVGGVGSWLARMLPVVGVSDAEANLYAPEIASQQETLYREAEKAGKELSDRFGANRIYRAGKDVSSFLSGGSAAKYTLFGRGVQQGMQSLGAMAPAMAASLLTRSPSFALSWAGLSEGAETFMEDAEKGKAVSKATAHALFNGAVEIGTEYIPMSRLIRDAAIGTPFLKTFARNWAAETPTEMAATALQTLSDRIADKKDTQEAGDVFMEWLEELPAAEMETAIAVLPMSLGFSGAARIRQIRASRATEAGIKALNDSSVQSKLRSRAKDVYETLVKTQTEGTKLENAYINADAWQTYFQSQGLDPREQAEQYGVTNYDEAITAGTDLVIPFSTYQSDFSGSDHAPYFVNDTRLSENGLTANEREAYLKRTQENAREVEALLEQVGKDHENARTVNDILSTLTENIAVQMEARYDRQTARTQAGVAARALLYPIQRDIAERAKEANEDLSPEDIAARITDRIDRYGLTIDPNATPTVLNTRRNIDPAIDSLLERLRKGDLPKEKDVYGPSLMEYIREKGGIRPDDITRDLVRNRQLPRSLRNENGMGADELAALQDILDFGLETGTAQGDNALLDALVTEHTTGEKKYSKAQLNGELLAQAQALNELSRDLAQAGIDLEQDNAAIREALSKYYEEQHGQNPRKEPETSQTDRYEQRGFTETDEPSAEERAEANRQYDEVEKKYKNTPLWMKAPNGEKTKLTERQWVQVRTPNFKRWFGDWERAGIRERLENQEPVAVDAEYSLETPAERREAAKALGVNTTANTPIGQIVIDAKSVKSTLQHGNTNAKLDVLKRIKDIAEASVYLEQADDFDGKAHKNFYLATRINRGGNEEIVFLRVIRRNGREERLHVHAVFTEDEIKNKDPVSALDETRQGEAQNDFGGYPRGPNLYKSILQDIYAVDKDTVSKVVDENGEPLVVYHATDAGTREERIRKIRSPEFLEKDRFLRRQIEKEDKKLRGDRDALELIRDEEYISKKKALSEKYKKERAKLDQEYPGTEVKEIIERPPVFVFDKKRIGNNVGTSTFGFMGTGHVGFWFNSGGDLSQMGDNVMSLFLNIANPYDAKDLDLLAAGIESTGRKTPKAAAKAYLKKLEDNDGIVLKDTELGGTSYVVFEPDQIKSAIGNIGTFTDNPNILFQDTNKKKGKVRGATTILPDRTMRIELFRDADYSTFMHETAHFMLEVYGDLASSPDASTYIQTEYATIRAFLGAEKDRPITREQHEKFARSFEAYLMEGKAPSQALMGIFHRFKTWLFHIYRSLKKLNAPLNRDIREVFDRMLASDDEIALMREANERVPLFATAEKLGVAEDEFEAYRRLSEKELVKAQDILREKAMKHKVREKTKAYRDELEVEKKKVEKEYDRDPVVMIFNDLTGENDFSLNEAELTRVYGKAFLSKLPKKGGKRIYSKDGQISLDDLAESFDFASGDELIRALAQLPDRQEYVNEKARANLLERDGDFLNNDQVALEAEDALDNEFTEARLKKELAILNRLKAAGKAAKRAEARQRTEERKEARRIEEDVASQTEAMKVASVAIIAGKKVKDVRPSLYLRALQSASRRAKSALNKARPDYAAAARAKQAEVMNHFLYREASQVQKEIGRKTLQAKAIARKPLRDAVRTRDALGVNKAKYIVARIGLYGNPEKIGQRIRTEEKNRGLDEAFEYDVAAPLKELDTATARDVLEDIRANWDQARRDKVMVIEGKRVEIEAAAEAVSKTLKDFGPTWRSRSKQDTVRNALLKRIGNIVLDNTRMEAWCDMVDGDTLGKEMGPMMRYLFLPVKQAADRARLVQAEYTRKLTAVLDGFQFTKETIDAPELGYVFGRDTGYGKAELVHALLHTGNMSNLQRLIAGRKWGTLLNGQIDTRRWNAFCSRMIEEDRITEEDLDRVQQIWDLFEELKPQSQQAYREVFGRFFDEITASPFYAFGKRYAGGYVPAIYDYRESEAGSKQLDPTRDLINEMGSALPKLAAGWGNSRIEGFSASLLLDLSALRNHLNRQILFSHLAPVNKDVSGLLNQENVRMALKEYDPDFFENVITPWLSRAITQNLEATGSRPSPWDPIVRNLRARAGASAMFGNAVNAIEQVFDMTAAFNKVKRRYLTDAFKTMISDRKGTVQSVMEASAYMRGRLDNEVMSANGKLKEALRPGKLKKAERWMLDHAYFLQASVDEFCGPLTWMAAYNQATESGMPHAEAVAQADSVVRQTFGSNSAEDISNFEGGSPLKRMFTQFMGYFVQRANLVAGEMNKIQRSDAANKKALAAVMLLQTVFLPAWVGAALRKFASGSDDDETFGSWLMDVFGWGTLNYGLSMGSMGGQAANAAIDSWRSKSFSSGRVFYPPAIKLIEDAFKKRKWETSDGSFAWSKFIQDLEEIERVIPGLPIAPARPVASLRYIYDVSADEVNPTGTYDFIRGVTTGRASPDSKK